MNDQKKYCLYLQMLVVLVISVVITSQSVSFAATSQSKTQFQIMPGPLSVTPTKKRVNFEVQGDERVAYADAGSVKIVDATGSWSGWHVMVQASRIIEVTTDQEKAQVLPEGSLSLSLKDAVIKPAEGSAAPPVWVGGTTQAIDVSGSVTILSAKQNDGMGSYHVNFSQDSLVLKIPESFHHNTKGKYEGTMTWTIIQGPS